MCCVFDCNVFVVNTPANLMSYVALKDMNRIVVMAIVVYSIVIIVQFIISTHYNPIFDL